MKLKIASVLCGSAMAATLALSMPADSAVDAGKRAYQLSCVRCHGELGLGNSSQDQFWKMNIPRLNSSDVQKKSDAELKTIILNGKRTMPPVMMGGSETQHQTRVTEQQAPNLIVYIRSLKTT